MTIQEQKHEPDTHTRPENAAKCAMYCAARVDLEKNTSIKAATLDYKVTKRAINCDFYASTAIVMRPATSSKTPTREPRLTGRAGHAGQITSRNPNASQELQIYRLDLCREYCNFFLRNTAITLGHG